VALRAASAPALACMSAQGSVSGLVRGSVSATGLGAAAVYSSAAISDEPCGLRRVCRLRSRRAKTVVALNFTSQWCLNCRLHATSSRAAGTVLAGAPRLSTWGARGGARAAATERGRRARDRGRKKTCTEGRGKGCAHEGRKEREAGRLARRSKSL
jgi:hypothetical protein